MKGLLEDRKFEHRNVVMLLLGESGHREAIPSLTRALRDSKEDFVVRCAAADALGTLGGDDAVDALLSTLEDKDELVKGHAVEAAVKAGLRADKLSILERALQSTRDVWPFGL